MDATLRFTVTDDDTAVAVGSGSLPVLGTPRLLAWCEAATCAAIEPTLPVGSTSVGTRIALEHLAAQRGRPGGRGDRVLVVRRRTAASLHGRLLATSGGKVIGTGEVTRVVVDAERFMSRL